MIAIGVNGAFQACVHVVDKSTGNKFISTAVDRLEKKLPSGVHAKFIVINKDNEISKAIYVDFLPKALAEGKYVAAPDPYVIGKGLENVQAALQTSKKGVSAKKVVVML